MLNEERVKYMTKLAFYETKGGNEDLKISFYDKKDYIGRNTLWAGLWITLAYIAIVVLVAVTLMSGIWETLSSKQLLVVGLSFLGIYIILLLMYLRSAREIYRKRHANAYHRVKKFEEELGQLEKLYEKEDGNE